MSSEDENDISPQDDDMHESVSVENPCEADRPVCKLELDIGDSPEDEKLDLVTKLHASGAVFACLHKDLVKLDGELSPMQFTLSSDGDCLAVSDDGRNVVVGLRSGQIVIVHFEIEAIVIYTRVLPGDFSQCDVKRTMVDIVLRRRGKGVYDILVIMASGHVFRLRGVNLESAKTPEAFSYSGDVEVLRDNLPGEKVNTSCTAKKFGMPMIFMGGNVIVSLSEEDGSTVSNLQQTKYTLRKLIDLESANLLIGLTEDHHMVAIDAYTLTIVKLWHKYSVRDFELLYGESQTRVALLTTPEQFQDEDFLKCHLIMVTLPDFEEHFKAEVNPITFLIGGKTNEMTYFESCGVGFLQKKIQFLQGPLPHQARLHQLLEQNRLEEAVELARREGLDTRPIIKARTLNLVRELVPWEDTEHQHSAFDDILSLLGQFEFVGFLGKFCDITITTDYEHTTNFFAYAQKKLDSRNVDEEGRMMSREHAALLCTVSNILLRLNTFKILYPSQSVEGSKWLDFYLCDLYKECLRFLSQGYLSHAALVWSRHNTSFCMKFSMENVQELTTLPEEVSLDDYLRWLKCVLPTLLNRQPSWYKLILVSAMTRIRAVELKQDSWPSSALNFACQLRNFLHSSKRLHADVMSAITLDYQEYDEASLVKQFYNLIFVLEQLNILHRNHHIRISWVDFMQTDKVEVVYSLLNQVRPANIAAFLDNFLAQYMLDHGLDHDQVLFGYISNLVTDVNWWDSDTLMPGWEDTVAVLIRCVYDYAVQEQCVVAVLKNAQVPWSDTINDLIKEGVKLKQPLASEIRQQMQLVDAKLIMKKYGLKNISQINRKVIQYILRQGNEDCLQDALQFASSSQKLTDEVYVIFIQEYISSGQEERALELLSSLPLALAARICRQSVFRVMVELEQEAPNEEECEQFVASLRLARLRLARLSEAAGGSMLDFCCAPELENMCHISQQRGVTLNEKMYSTVRVRSQLLESFVGKFVEAGEYSHGKIRQMVARLTRLFMCRQEEVLLLLGIQNVELQKGPELTEKVLELLCVNCESWTSTPIRLHSFLCRVLCGEKSLTATAAAHLEQMVCTLCATCGKSELHEWVSLYSWACLMKQSLAKNAANTLNSRDPYVRWRLTPLYYDAHPGLAEVGIPNFVSNFLLFVMYYSRKKTWQRTDRTFYLNFNNNDSKWLKSTKHRRKEFLLKMESMYEALHQSSDLLSLQAVVLFAGSVAMLQTSLEKYRSGSEVQHVRTKLSETLDKCLPVLLLKVISAIRIDPMFALGVRCSFTSCNVVKLVHEYLNRFSSDSYRSKLLTQLGLQFCLITDELTGRDWYKDLLKRLRWSEKLISLEVSCGDLFRGDSSFVGVVLDRLISAKAVNLNTIVEYCYDFDVGLFASLTKYLEKIVSSWEPMVDVVTNFDGNGEMAVKNDEEEVFTKCKEVVDLLKVEYEKRISVFLIELMNSINFYHYEMYMCVFRLLRTLNTSHQFRISNIVLYLKTYQRNKPPQQEEKEQWRQRFSDSDCLPPIAKWRLPLEVFIEQDKWKVLKLLNSEINLNTYNRWLMACGTLPLERDRILGIAIKESVAACHPDWGSPPKEWCVYKRDSALLNQIKQCAEQFSDLELASAALYFVAHHMPPGQDQSSAAELCYTYTKMWARNKKTAQASQLVEKMQQKYLRCATSNVLYSQGLGQSSYIVFSLDPKQLLRLLYQHPSIVDRSRGVLPDYPDINKAAKMLADLHELDLYEFWPEQVKEWMMPYQNTTQQDEVTMDLTVMLCKPEQNPTIEENLIRVCYILQLNSKEESSNFLFSLAFKDVAGLSDYTLRLRALKCLVGFADPKFLENITYMTTEQIRRYMRSLYFVSELQQFGMVFSVESFEKACKKSIVRDLMHAHNRNLNALTLMSQICVEFSMFSAELWAQLLRQLSKFKLVKQLEYALLGISGTQYHVLRSPSGVIAWNTVLLEPFIAVDGAGMSDEDEWACMHSLNLLQYCSAVDLVNRQAIADQCLRLGRPDMAALLLPYATQAERTTLLQEIYSIWEPARIRTSLQKLTEHGLLIAVQAADLLPA